MLLYISAWIRLACAVRMSDISAALSSSRRASRPCAMSPHAASRLASQSCTTVRSNWAMDDANARTSHDPSRTQGSHGRSRAFRPFVRTADGLTAEHHGAMVTHRMHLAPTPRRTRTVVALNHAKGRSKPHQNGAHMTIPARVTTTPVARGTRRRAPPTASTRHDPRNANSTGTVTVMPWASNGPLPYVGFPNAYQTSGSRAACQMAGMSKAPKPAPLTTAQRPARRSAPVTGAVRCPREVLT